MRATWAAWGRFAVATTGIAALCAAPGALCFWLIGQPAVALGVALATLVATIGGGLAGRRAASRR